jgi:hypothetical protein
MATYTPQYQADPPGMPTEAPLSEVARSLRQQTTGIQAKLDRLRGTNTADVSPPTGIHPIEASLGAELIGLQKALQEIDDDVVRLINRIGRL